MYQVHGHVKKRGGDTSHKSPEDNGIKNASVNVADIPTSNSSNSTASSCDSLLSIEDDAADPYLAMPSFDAQLAAVLATRPTLPSSSSIDVTRRLRSVDTTSLSEQSSSSSVLPAIPKTRRPMGRPKKPVPENPEPKRPVGRPRIHPKKELDPNRQKRVAKGDKPLGRPRTRPPTPPDFVKRPRGRPRKIDAPPDALTLPDSPPTLSEILLLNQSEKAGFPSLARSSDGSNRTPGSTRSSLSGSQKSAVVPAGNTPPTAPDLAVASNAHDSVRVHGARHSARLTPPSTSAAALPVAPNSTTSKSDTSVRSVLSKRRYA